MEEDLRVVEEMLDIDKHLGKFLSDNRRQAIENLIKRNKELEEERDNLIIQKNADYYKISKLKDDLDEVEGDRDYNYIPKSKIREKIEELNKRMAEDEVDEFGIHSQGWAALDWTRDFLLELVQEGDK